VTGALLDVLDVVESLGSDHGKRENLRGSIDAGKRRGDFLAPACRPSGAKPYLPRMKSPTTTPTPNATPTVR
jgi:hypothetical protein